MYRILLTCLLAISGWTLTASCQTEEIEISIGLETQPTGRDSFLPYRRILRPKVALALSGGGARGLAQIGVLKAFEQQGIPVDGVAGTSMGAIIGGLFCAGYTAVQIESLATEIRWEDIIHDTPPREQLFLGQKSENADHILQIRLRGITPYIPSAFTEGQRLTSLLSDLLLRSTHPVTTDFDRLSIPFRAVTTDFLTGKKVVLKQGSLVNALRASMAIPLLFTPVRIDGRLLLDGGLVQNLPVDEARSLGADLVIAVDTSSRLRTAEDLGLPWEIADQVTTIMQQEQLTSQMEEADVVIQPRLEDISNTDFSQITNLIEAGRLATERILPQIEDALDKRGSTTPLRFFRIHSVTVEGCRTLNKDSLIAGMDLDTTHRISDDHIQWTGRTLYQSGAFRSVSCRLDTSTQRLLFIVEEQPPVRRIQITGCSRYSPDSLIARMETRPGAILNIHKARRDRRMLLDTYQNDGYVLASIEHADLSDDGTLTIAINEGRLNRIRMQGNDHTRAFVIERELNVKPGELITADQIHSGMRNIFSTGYFETVQLEPRRNGKTYDLHLTLKELGFTLLHLGLQYNLERRTQAMLQIVRENLLGFGSKSSVTGLLGKRDEMVEVRLWSDRLFRTMLTYDLTLSAKKQHFHYYNAFDRVGGYERTHLNGSFTIGQHMRRLGTISLKYRAERIILNPSAGGIAPSDDVTLRNLTFRSEVDTRDRMPFPRRGNHHVLEYETATGLLGSRISYVKIWSSMAFFYPLTDGMILHPRIAWGTADQTTPFVKQYRLGGLDSFMGLPEEALVGKRFLALRLEGRLRMPWPRWLESYLALRYDLGGIWGRYTEIVTTDFKQGAGAVLSINTIAGPIQLGYGVTSDSNRQLYFSAGYRF